MNHGWNGDAVLIGRILESSEQNGGISEKSLPALRRVRVMLQARGVQFPVGELINLQRDSRGFYVQPSH